MAVNRSKKLLIQLQDIVDFTGISGDTLKKMAKDKKVKFPMQKFLGTWYSSTEAIEQWMMDSCYTKKKAVKK